MGSNLCSWGGGGCLYISIIIVDLHLFVTSNKGLRMLCANGLLNTESCLSSSVLEHGDLSVVDMEQWQPISGLMDASARISSICKAIMV